MAYWLDSLEAGTLTQSELDQLQWQLDRMDSVDATLADAAEVFDILDKETLAAEYKELIGYDPFLDDPEISVETVAQTLREFKEVQDND